MHHDGIFFAPTSDGGYMLEARATRFGSVQVQHPGDVSAWYQYGVSVTVSDWIIFAGWHLTTNANVDWYDNPGASISVNWNDGRCDWATGASCNGVDGPGWLWYNYPYSGGSYWDGWVEAFGGVGGGGIGCRTYIEALEVWTDAWCYH